jgi:hypothetical protein
VLPPQRGVERPAVGDLHLYRGGARLGGQRGTTRRSRRRRRQAEAGRATPPRAPRGPAHSVVPQSPKWPRRPHAPAGPIAPAVTRGRAEVTGAQGTERRRAQGMEQRRAELAVEARRRAGGGVADGSKEGEGRREKGRENNLMLTKFSSLQTGVTKIF